MEASAKSVLMMVRGGSEQASRAMTAGAAAQSAAAVSLEQVEPDLHRWLTAEQVDEARRWPLPLLEVDVGADLSTVLQPTDAFGALLLDGLLLHSVQIHGRGALRLIAPGGLLPLTPMTPSLHGERMSVSAAMPSRIVLLDDHFLVATRRWPPLLQLLHARSIDQTERLAVQLAISHLPRVEDRLIALMWLLADDLGRVTEAGTRLRLPLTHEAIGEVIGARRSTVTLALSELAARGSLITERNDWLILEPPPEPRLPERRRAHVLHTDE
jgi:CRP/FNR family cyclic AMP-dependent transcriptional regulator